MQFFLTLLLALMVVASSQADPIRIIERGPGSISLTERGRGNLFGRQGRVPINIYESGRGGVRLNERGRGNLIGRHGRAAELEVGAKPMTERAANPDPVNIHESGRGGVRLSEQGRGALIG